MDDLEVVRAAIDSFNRLDDQAASALFHPRGHEVVPLRAAVEGTVFRGPDAYRRFLAASRDMWSEIAVEVDEIRPVRPGRVVLLGRLVGTSRDTGLEAAAPCGWVFELRDGMITSARTYPDPDEAIRAAEA